uniref:ARAD1C23166p n=1 Tax=Blastobotrys adeninivorans TaxID=409370 RepID=A0A060T1A5_BLAAD
MEPEKKSKRVIGNLACQKCRRRKIRCLPVPDPSKYDSPPPCQTCAKLDIPCIFTDRGKRGPGKKKRIEEAGNGDKSSVRKTSPRSCPSGPPLSSGSSVSSVSSGFPGVGAGILAQPEANPIPWSNAAMESSSESSAYLASTSSSPKVPNLSPGLPDILSTDLLCSRIAFDDLIRTYLTHLYPLTPIVHRPTFVKDLESHRETRDPVFFSMVIALCAFTIATAPRKFRHLKEIDPSLPYKSFDEMFNRCYELVIACKNVKWITRQTISVNHFASVFLISLADHYIEGDHVRASVGWHEALGILKALRAHKWPEGYRGLNSIESELRKRCLWLIYFKTSMDRLWSSELKLGEPSDLLILEPGSLMPADADDEYITPTGILPAPPGSVPLLRGFIANIRVHLSLEYPRITDIPIKHTGSETLVHCRQEEYRARQVLKRVKGLSGVLPKELSFEFVKSPDFDIVIANIPTVDDLQAQWYKETPEIRRTQFESQCSNITVTQLWIQNGLLEYLDYLRKRISSSEVAEGLTTSRAAEQADRLVSLDLWNERQQLCERLIQVISEISLENMEPNGISIIIKLRMICFSLLDYKSDGREEISVSAASFLSKIMNHLVTLEVHRGRDAEQEGWEALELANPERYNKVG